MTAGEGGLGGFNELLGVELLDSGEDWARARVAAGDHLMQPYGVVHGGVYASLAETVCSAATHEGVSADGMVALGQSNHTTFLRPITEGHLNAEARARHRGRTSWVWEVEITDDRERLCALVRMTVAVRPSP
jgi:1,4-dihydroxy-2-naphthoyl-CoA hydrolase